MKVIETVTDQWMIPGGGLENGETEIKQTQREQEVGMIPKWLTIDEIKDIFSKHNTYAESDEMRRGMYLREYTALTELV